jgi:2-phospho-L-lactate guanylyltransferase
MITALVPFKDSAHVKSRLAQVLSEEQRRALARRMLDHVIDVLRGTDGVDRVAILSPTDPGIARTTWMADHGRGLNPEIESAIAHIAPDAVLIIHADLPRVERDDIAALVAPSRTHDVVIAPDKAGTGTNALLFAKPAGDFRLSFGPGSFAAHCQTIEQRGWSLAVVRRAGLSLDIDDPADLSAAGLSRP